MSNDNPLIPILENLFLTPSSEFYISTVLYNPDGTSADPLTAAEIDVGTMDGDGVEIGVVLKQVVIKGLSNTQVKFDTDNKPEITVDGDQVTFHAKLPNTQAGYERPQGVPDQVEMASELDIALNGTAMPPGTLSGTIRTVADITGVFTATQKDSHDPQTVQIQMNKLVISPATADGNITITVDLNTVFKGVINTILNTPENLDKMVAALNTELAKPETLRKLSDALTDQARKALAGIEMAVPA